MLSGKEIFKQLVYKNIVISPFNEKNLGPNSYDLTLGPQLKTYDLYHHQMLDAREDNPTIDHRAIGDEGFVLQPNILYLAHTNEIAGSTQYMPYIDGRSSIGRLGIQVHLTAGRGDVGFIGQWTLEILVVHPVKVYVGMRICQIYFDTIYGDIGKLYDGKYNDSKGVIASKSFQDYDMSSGIDKTERLEWINRVDVDIVMED